jgi:hypothetical protein
MRAGTLALVTLSIAALAGSAPLQAQHRPSSVLTAEEIERARLNVSTAYDVVQMLRPRWLQQHELARLPGSPSHPLEDTSVRVYLNDRNMGAADFLKTLSVEMVQEMRWLSVNEAASRFGPTNGQAAIAVTLKR